jgi:hypothetical protein
MSEADLIEAIAAYNSSSQGWVGLYISILSAYIIAAYLAGNNLTFSQSAIVSTGFMIFAFLCVFGATANGSRILEFTYELRELNPDRNFAMREWVLLTMGTLMVTGVFVALKFMWDIRHPKKR